VGLRRRTVYSYPDATPHEVWARDRLRMPRLPRDVLDCSVYLYNSREDAIAGARYGASGFLLVAPCTRLDIVKPASVLDQIRVALGRPAEDDREARILHAAHCYLVTNRHVLSRFARVNTVSGGHRILDLRDELWVDHEDGDDISVCHIEPQSPTDQYVYIHTDLLLDDSAVEDLAIGSGDEVFMVGRFIDHGGIQRNYPSVRFGHIAMMPNEPIRSERPDGSIAELTGYLVEAYSYVGYSGSPVFLHLPPWELEFLGAEDIGRKAAGQEVSTNWLLGINWGHFPAEIPAKSSTGREVFLSANAGMMCVAPAAKILEVLNNPDFIEERCKDREEWARSGAATMD
jgi:hypothetical protein